MNREVAGSSPVIRVKPNVAQVDRALKPKLIQLALLTILKNVEPL